MIHTQTSNCPILTICLLHKQCLSLMMTETNLVAPLTLAQTLTIVDFFHSVYSFQHYLECHSLFYCEGYPTGRPTHSVQATPVTGRTTNFVHVTPATGRPTHSVQATPPTKWPTHSMQATPATVRYSFCTGYSCY
uniref:Uncharacterized protein n=1 Tax=Amphimedon queenslandica TaxID=400682 RepID=A0A1X7VAM8_AMPQE